MEVCEDCAGDETCKTHCGTTTRGRQWQLDIVDEARAKLGRLRENAANRLVVDRVVRDLMAVKGMRPSHIRFYSPVAVELYFVPTQQDVIANAVRLSRTKAAMLKGVDNSPVC